MAEENIFRFLSVRPANLKSKTNLGDRKIQLYDVENGKTTELYHFVDKAVKEGVSMAKLQEIAKRFKQSDQYLNDIEELSFGISKLYEWFSINEDKKFDNAKLSEAIEKIFGKKADEVVKQDEYQTSILKLADAILIDAIDRSDFNEQNSKYITCFKLFNIINAIADKNIFLRDKNKLGEYLTETAIIIPRFLNPKKYIKTEEKIDSKEEAPKEDKKDKILAQLRELEVAYKELSSKGTDDKYRFISKKSKENDTRLTNLEQRVQNLTRQKTSKVLEGKQQFVLVSNAATKTIDKSNSEFLFSFKAIEEFSQTTKDVIKSLNTDTKSLNPIKALKEIENKMAELSDEIAYTSQPSSIIMLGGAYLDAQTFKKSIGYYGSKEGYVRDLMSSCKFQVGVGDLLMVKQKLKAYELAEFAHVENVLAGELRRREHRRLNLTEEVQIVETDRETEKERDLQSTERNELQNEAEKTVKSQFELEAGLQVSGSYGPVVSFSASLNAGFSNSTEEHQKKSSSYSRQVTEKSAEKIRERVREERRRRVLEEIEEKNLHEINNADAANGHIRGIYRWLNKVYDAQVFNYGQRMMYEFVIPEPAAYFLYAMVENPPKEIEIVKPVYPTFSGRALRPTDLSRANYAQYVSAYNLTNIPNIPSQFSVISHFDKQDEISRDNNSTFGRSGKVTIEAGYAAYGAFVSTDWSAWDKDGAHAFRLSVGGRNFDHSTIWGTTYQNFDRRFEKEISIAMQSANVKSFTLGVDIFCELTTEGFAKWQNDMFEAIMNAYLQQKAEYDEKIAALEIQKGVQILGRNPLENRRLERDELKKLIIMMLTKSPYLYLNSYLSDSGEPFLDMERACVEGSYIRFFENAFEWNNLMYVLYPYFWGRHSKWITALHLTDPDADFAAFLKAGAARVQIPVRPGFERAVAHFCQFGQIWEGNDIPLRDDDLYVPIVDEITENLGKLDGGVPYPEDSEPWEVIVPTSLVVLQNLEEIGGIRDVLTNKDIDIQPNQE